MAGIQQKEDAYKTTFTLIIIYLTICNKYMYVRYILGYWLRALLYNFTSVYIQVFPLVGGTSRRRVSPYKREYLYVHEYLYDKILVSITF